MRAIRVAIAVRCHVRDSNWIIIVCRQYGEEESEVRIFRKYHREYSGRFYSFD